MSSKMRGFSDKAAAAVARVNVLEESFVDKPINDEIAKLLYYHVKTENKRESQEILCRYDQHFLMVPPKSRNNLLRSHRLPQPRPKDLKSFHDLNTNDFELTDFLAIDCEMVQSRKSPILARVAVVNEYGVVLYDTYVRPSLPVTNYASKWSGITPSILAKAETRGEIVSLHEAQLDIQGLITGRFLIGHAIKNDLNVLQIDHPESRTIDTQKLIPVHTGRSLQFLSETLYNIPIQRGSKGHNPVEDASSTMLLFRTFKEDMLKVKRKQTKRANYASPTKILGFPKVPVIYTSESRDGKTPQSLSPMEVYENTLEALGSKSVGQLVKSRQQCYQTTLGEIYRYKAKRLAKKAEAKQ